MASQFSFNGPNSGSQVGINKGQVHNHFHTYTDPDKADETCLRDLMTSDPREDKDRIEEIKGGLLKDVFRWVLDDSDFKDWLNDPNRRILWIRGDPGKGKTMLVCGLIDELPILDPDATLAFAFCQANNAKMNDATSVLRGIIYMIVTKCPELLHHVRRRYDQGGRDAFEGTNSWWALVKIFTDILAELPRTYIAVDALDECTSDRKLLLDLISIKAATYPHIKWLVSSRDWPEIDEQLHTDPRENTLSLELNSRNIKTAVEKYIHHKVDQLAKLKGHDSIPQEDIRTRLLSGSEGTFLWVALAYEELVRTEPWNILETLESTPRGLDAMYARMLERINHSKSAELYNQILAVVLTVYRPITLGELFHLGDILTEKNILQHYLPDIIKSCGSFLTVRGTEIFFVHQSASEFLVNHSHSTIFPLGHQSVHGMISRQSLKCLSKNLERNVYNIEDPGCPVERVKIPDPDPLASSRYPCIFWVDHLEAALSHTKRSFLDLDVFFGAEGLVYNFLTQDYLPWLEALSISRSIFEGIAAILQLEELIKNEQGNSKQKYGSLLLHLQDASRFARYHRPAIESAPIQVYYSALIFSPPKSLTRINYKRYMPDLIRNEPMKVDHWGRCLQTLQENSKCIHSVVWSPDGIVATGSRDNMVRTWNPSTGKCLSTLKGHQKAVYSVGWSLIGTLASGSEDGTIKIWDLPTESCSLTLSEGNEGVHSIAWSPDGSLLCSGSRKGFLRIWDISTKTLTRTLKGHTEGVSSLSWGQDGRLASLGESIIRVWNPISGECLSVISGCGPIRSISWSRDGQIGAASDSNVVSVWSPYTELCHASLEGHEHNGTSVSWSANGLLASGSLDCTIKIWDPAIGRLIETLEGHGDGIMAVDWAEDGRLASASSDGTIRIWDLERIPRLTPAMRFLNRGFMILWTCFATLVWSIAASKDRKKPIGFSNYERGITINPLTEKIEPIKTHPSEQVRTVIRCTFWLIIFFNVSLTKLLVLVLVIAPTCSVLWSKKIVRIWVPAEGTGSWMTPGDGEQRSVTSLAWSPDKSRLVSGSKDTTAKIWNTVTGDCLLTLEGHAHWIRGVDWAPKGLPVACGSLDGTVTLWNAMSGKCERTIAVGQPVLDVRWSCSGRFLATRSLKQEPRVESTIKVWASRTNCIFSLENLSGDEMFFDMEDNLHTSSGVFDMLTGDPVEGSSSSSDPNLSTDSDFALNDSLSWITYQGKNLIFLPFEYRSREWSSQNTVLAIGCHSGQVLIINFSKDGPKHE